MKQQQQYEPNSHVATQSLHQEHPGKESPLPQTLQVCSQPMNDSSVVPSNKGESSTKVLDDKAYRENCPLSEFTHDEACILLVKINGIHDLVDSLMSNDQLHNSTNEPRDDSTERWNRGATLSSHNSALHHNNNIFSHVTPTQPKNSLVQHHTSHLESSRRSQQVQHVCKSISNIYTVLISIIYSLGGDLERFDPEELVCQFHSPQIDPTRSINESLLSAIECGLRIQKTDLSKTFKSLQNRKLEVRCIVTFGPVKAYHVGGHKNRWFRLFTGSAFNEANEKIQQCKAGQVVFTRSVYNRVKQSVLTVGDKELSTKGVVVADMVKKEVAQSGVQNITFHASFGRIIKMFIPPLLSKATTDEERIDYMPDLVCSLKIGQNNLMTSPEDSDLQLTGRHELVRIVHQAMGKYDQKELCKMFEDTQHTITVIFSFAIGKMKEYETLFDMLNEIAQQVDTIGIGISFGYCLRIANFGSEIRRDFGLFGRVANTSLQLMRESYSNYESYILCEPQVAELVFHNYEKEIITINDEKYVKLLKSLRNNDVTASVTGENAEQISLNFSISGLRKEHETNVRTSRQLFMEEVDTMISQLISLKGCEVNKSIEKNKVIVIKGEKGLGKTYVLRKILEKWKNKIVCLTNNSKFCLAKPCSLFHENLKMIVTEFFLRQLGIDLDYTCFDAVYSTLSSDQKQQVVSSVIKNDQEFETLAKYCFLLNPILGIHFRTSEAVDSLDESTTIRKASQLVSKILLRGWKHLGYSNQEPWLLFCDDIHLYDPYSRGVLEYLFKFAHTEGMSPGLLFITMNLTQEVVPSLHDDAIMMELQSIHSNEEDSLNELQQWCEVSTLTLELPSLSKEMVENCIFEMTTSEDCYSYLTPNCEGVEACLTQFIFEKTEGNALSISLLLLFLNDMKLLRVNDKNMLDFDRSFSVSQLHLPQTHSEYYSRQLQQLVHEKQLVLEVAALNGGYFDLKTIVKGATCLDSTITPERIRAVLCELVHTHGILEVVEQFRFQQCRNRHEETFYTFKNRGLQTYLKDVL
ncbi:hypothetical protein C9374_002893 [Naegleria lovaniensis]|uniref:Uncharacterized protein n=1 Tax=Naegleria lovaniensis TaxID=51637 RepID=A0AA88GU04_NAELO|nr:uncharacterized protein C9374_002893 [Naegleria lovaniensis]KAG2385744.1 hypothetical protein C9374_002893 [Naegleria lovaniensis]